MEQERRSEEDLRRMIDARLDQLGSDEEIEGVLDVIGHCRGQSFDNQILLCAQCPKARIVAGAGGWKRLGGVIREGEKPPTILLPSLQYIPGSARVAVTDIGTALTDKDGKILYDRKPQYNGNLIPVRVYDLSQVEGDLPNDLIQGRDPHKPVSEDSIHTGTPSDASLLQKKILSLGILIQSDPISELPTEYPDGYWEMDTLHLPDRYEENPILYNRNLLNLFTAWYVHLYLPDVPEIVKKEADTVIAFAGYTLSIRLYGKEDGETIRGLTAAFQELGKNDKITILQTVSRITETLSQYIEGFTLDFMETAILNSLLDTGNTDDFCDALRYAGQCVQDQESLLYAINSLADKIASASEGFLKELYERKLYDNVILTVPATRIPMKNPDGPFYTFCTKEQ